MPQKKRLNIEELIKTRDKLIQDLRNIELAKAKIEGGINVINSIINSTNVKQ